MIQGQLNKDSSKGNYLHILYKGTLSVSVTCKNKQCPRLDNVVTNDGDLRVCKKVIGRFSALAHRFLEITMVISGALALLEAAAIYENAKSACMTARGKWLVKSMMTNR